MVLILISWVLPFGACSGITTHCFFISLPHPPVVIQVFCNVVFEFVFLFLFCFVFSLFFCLFVQKSLTKSDCLRSGGCHWQQEAGRSTWGGRWNFLDSRCKSLREDWKTSCSHLAHWPPCSLASGCSFWVLLGQTQKNICCVQSEC